MEISFNSQNYKVFHIFKLQKSTRLKPIISTISIFTIIIYTYLRMDLPEDDEMDLEFSNFPQIEDYFYDDFRFQQREEEYRIDEELQRQERIKRAKWLNNYYNYKDQQILRRTRASNINSSEDQQTNTPTPSLTSQYARQLNSQKNMWTSQFIDETVKSRQFIREYHGVEVVFPKDPYPQQEQFVKTSIQCLNTGENCFQESPTGTGKTFCQLIGSLGWLYYQKNINKQHKKIIYLSRTHSQLQQVVKQLKQTCYRPTMTIMGAREHSCINQKINRQFKGHDLIEKCNESRNAYFRLKKMDKDAPYGDEEIKELCKTMCPHFKERYQTVKNCQQYHNKVLQLEDFKGLGEKCFCPYFYPLYMQDHCDLFLMPYNYLLDVRIFERYADLINNSILIFDEAHNVADACCEGRSFQARFSMFDGFCKEFQALEIKPAKYKADQKQLDKIRSEEMMKKLKDIGKQMSNLKETVLEYLNQIPFHKAEDHQNKVKSSKLFYQGQEKKLKWSKVVSSSNVEQTLVELVMGLSCAEKQLYLTSWPHRLQFNANTVSRLKHIIEMKERIVNQFKQIKGFSFFNIEQSCRFLNRIIYLFESHLNNNLSVYHDQLKHYCLVFSVQLGDTMFESNDHRNIVDYRISLNCLVPWFTFKEIQSCKPYSIFFTSGTMHPIEEWKHELNIKGRQFVNKHVIEDHQIQLNIISHNENQERFNFSYQFMNPKENNIVKRYEQMLKMIVTLLTQIPGGVLVIFPNYKYVENTKNYLNSMLCRFKEKIKKKQFFEQRGSLQQIKDYKNHIKSGKEGVLFGVCRGKASEGIDFPDNQCRAVIFIGIPYPNAYAPLMMEKQMHYKKHEGSTIPQLKEISWGAYYFNSTIRAINQGLGRVIRHKYDYGQLFLLDCRFLQPQKWYVKKKRIDVSFKDYLPGWATKRYFEWGDDPQNIRQKLLELRGFYQFNRIHTVRPI